MIFFRSTKNKLKTEKILGLFLIVLLSLVFVYWQVDNINEKLKKNILEIGAVGIRDFAKNSESLFLENFTDNENISQILDSEAKLNKIEKSLEILNSKSYKYIYVVYRDRKTDRYRFLIDSTKEKIDPKTGKIIEKKSRRNSIFFVGDYKKRYDEALKNNHGDLIFHQQKDNSLNLYVTFIQPIKISSKEKALFSLDFSVNLEKFINNIVQNIKSSIIFLIFLLSLVLIGLLIFVIKAILDQDKAFLDDLTNTYNRKYLNYLNKKENLGNTYSVMMLDIDHFKKVNDTYGHQVGDYVLINMVSAVKSCVNANDILIRYGGEEFLLLIKNKDTHICDMIAQRILRSVEQNVTQTSKYRIKTTVSIGIDICEEDRKDIFEMIKHADEALYYSKENGRNQANFYECKDD